MPVKNYQEIYNKAQLTPFSAAQSTAQSLMRNQKLTVDNVMQEIANLNDDQLLMLQYFFGIGLRGTHLRAVQNNTSSAVMLSGDQLRNYFSSSDRVLPPPNSDTRDLIVLIKLQNALNAFDQQYPNTQHRSFIQGMLGPWEKTIQFINELKIVMNNTNSAREKNNAIYICLQHADSAGGTIINLLQTSGLIDKNKKPSLELFLPFAANAANLTH